MSTDSKQRFSFFVLVTSNTGIFSVQEVDRIATLLLLLKVVDFIIIRKISNNMAKYSFFICFLAIFTISSFTISEYDTIFDRFSLLLMSIKV